VCKKYKNAKTEGSVNSVIKTGLFPSNRHIFQDYEFACHGMDESQGKRTMELAMKFQDREHQTFVHNASGRKFMSPADVRPFPHLAPKCCAPIDQAKQTRVSCAKLLTASP